MIIEKKKISTVYKIFCKDSNILDCYIGSTTDYKKRCNGHKSSCNNPTNKRHYYKVYQFIRNNGGWDNFDTEILISAEIKDKKQLLQLERQAVNLFKPSLNVQIPLRTRAEYYIAHSDKIKNTQNQYRIDNIDKFLKVHSCICGSTYTFSNRHQHFKTKKHKKFMINHIENFKHLETKAKSARFIEN